MEPSSIETERLALLTSFVSRIRDGMAAFQPIAERAKTRFGVPIALVSVLDAERQIYLGNCGLAAPDAPRDQTFCNSTIRSPGVTVVEDTLLDPRFASHPFVTAAPRLRFYAGAPIVFPGDLRIGTVCVADVKPRRFGAAERMILEHLAATAATTIERLPGADKAVKDFRLMGRPDPALPAWEL